jgi:hypothetical protein
MEKIGLYAPVIAPLMIALAVGLGLQERKGASLVFSVIVMVGSLGLAMLAFRKIRKPSKPTTDP